MEKQKKQTSRLALAILGYGIFLVGLSVLQWLVLNQDYSQFIFGFHGGIIIILLAHLFNCRREDDERRVSDEKDALAKSILDEKRYNNNAKRSDENMFKLSNMEDRLKALENKK